MPRQRTLRGSWITLVLLTCASACAIDAGPTDEDAARGARDASPGLDDARVDASRGDAAATSDAASDAASSTATITAFTLRAADNHGLAGDIAATIDGTHIALTVPHGTAMTSLVPTVAFTGAEVAPASGVAQDFTHAVNYDVRAANGASATYDVAVTEAPECDVTAPVCDHAVYDRARAFAVANPTHDGGSWDGWCASLAYRFSDESHAAQPSAIAAYHASSIVSTDPSAAPIGALHYWDITVYGHVGVDLMGGGTTVFMASGYVAEAWAPSLGVQSVAGYNSRSHARYLGWSMDYAGSHVTGGGAAACSAPMPVPAGCTLPASATATSGVPDTSFWMHLQRYAAANGYTGPVDGVMGVASWAGVQRGLRSAGYTGPDDGVPGTNTYAAMQRIAAMYGYTGPVDGVLGANSYRGLATFLNANY